MKDGTHIAEIDPQEIAEVVAAGIQRRKRESFAKGLPWPITKNGVTRWEWPDGSITDNQTAKSKQQID